MPFTNPRHGTAGHPNPIAPPSVGHYFLDTVHRRLHCLNETARQLLDQHLPFDARGLARCCLERPDGVRACPEDLPLLTAWRDGAPREASFLWGEPGESRQVLTWSATPLVDSGGKVLGISTTVVLTTPEPDWEELAGLAHDIRTPLQALRLLVPAARSSPSPQLHAEVLERLHSSAERASAIGKEILHWCKAPVQGRRQAPNDWFALTPLLHELADEHDLTARAKGLVLEIDLTSVEGIEIRSHRVRIGRVIANLLSNAVRYTSSGRVLLQAMTKPSPGNATAVLVVAVEDTGSGIGEEEQESIFQPFQRGRASHTESDSGASGVGLTAVDRLVFELGLRLEVSSSPGKGSRFEVLVPGDLHRRTPSP